MNLMDLPPEVIVLIFMQYLNASWSCINFTMCCKALRPLQELAKWRLGGVLLAGDHVYAEADTQIQEHPHPLQHLKMTNRPRTLHLLCTKTYEWPKESDLADKEFGSQPHVSESDLEKVVDCWPTNKIVMVFDKRFYALKMQLLW